jgi:transcriptional regulator with XRE-family HTH domain
MSLRELAKISQVSNAYLSQIERGLHEPSLRVLSAVADALSMPLEEFLSKSSPDAPPPVVDVESAIRADPKLAGVQKDALIALYNSYIAITAATQAMNPMRRPDDAHS